MKLFLSWSGNTSHRVARILRDWLPSVIQAVRPYVSSEDIDKGARWSTDIAAELEQSSYGIICITRENVEAPWINFEAGALSKSIDKSHVTPFLFRMKRSEVQGPLLQFQSVIYERDELLKLVQSINRRLEEAERLSEEHLQRTFEVWWPRLQQEFEQISERTESKRENSSEIKENSEILEEILELVRSQQRLLNSPESLLPRPYLLRVLRREAKESLRIKRLRSGLHSDILGLAQNVRSLPGSDENRNMLMSVVDKIHLVFHEIYDGDEHPFVRRKSSSNTENLDMPAEIAYIENDDAEK